MGKIFKIGNSGTLSVYVFTGGAIPRPVHVDSFTEQATASIRLTVHEARELAAALTEAAKLAPLACSVCGEEVGESGVLEDGKATCGACYLANYREATGDETEVQP